MVESNFERYQEFNQQPDLSNKQIGEGRSSDTMHGCLQGKIQSDRSLDKLKLIIVFRGDFHNKEIIGYIWSPTASLITLMCFLEDCPKHKSRVHQFDFIGGFLRTNVKHRVL